MEIGSLVLQRKKGEIINIGNDIIITVVDIDPYNVRLLINAPKNIVVDRHEIRLRRQAEKELAQ